MYKYLYLEITKLLWWRNICIYIAYKRTNTSKGVVENEIENFLVSNHQMAMS